MAAQSFGKYQLVKKLATGGMAEVWLALQTGIEGFNRHVVVKRILPHLAEDPEFVQMFLNEAKIAARFNHPNIAQIYDLGEEGGQYYIAMEYIHGEDLGRVMRRAWSSQQWVARATAIRIIADACAGLYYAHTRTDEQGRPLKVVHRDISPQNILVSFDGSVKLVDFGIAKAADQMSSTKSGAIKGKFAYMAPEQAAGKPLDARCDQFALGLVLYELLTGVRPIKRDSEIGTLQAALACAIEAPSMIAEVPSHLDEVVMKALARNVDDRYRDARQFQMALEQLLVQEGTIATSVQVSELMELLFADRLSEEAKSGMPSPLSESSVSVPVALPLPKPEPEPDADPETIERGEPQDDDEDDATLAPDAPGANPFQKPSGTVVPTRGYLKNDGSGGAPRSTSRPATVSPRRKTSSLSGAPQPNNETADALPPVAEEARRRPTGSLRKRTTSGLAMPEAPPRKSRLNVPVAQARPIITEGRQAGASQLDVEALRARHSSRLKGVITLVLVAGLLVGGFVFKEPLTQALHARGGGGGIPVVLSVSTNPRTRVRVIPGPAAKGREPLELGDSPLDRVSGAYAGDSVELVSVDRGIRDVVSIDATTANQAVMVERTFREGTLKIRTRPPLKNATLWTNGVQLGRVGVPMKVFEGTHKLQIRADGLVTPVEFEARVLPSQITDQEVAVPGGN